MPFPNADVTTYDPMAPMQKLKPIGFDGLQTDETGTEEIAKKIQIDFGKYTHGVKGAGATNPVAPTGPTPGTTEIGNNLNGSQNPAKPAATIDNVTQNGGAHLPGEMYAGAGLELTNKATIDNKIAQGVTQKLETQKPAEEKPETLGDINKNLKDKDAEIDSNPIIAKQNNMKNLKVEAKELKKQMKDKNLSAEKKAELQKQYDAKKAEYKTAKQDYKDFKKGDKPATIKIKDENGNVIGEEQVSYKDAKEDLKVLKKEKKELIKKQYKEEIEVAKIKSKYTLSKDGKDLTDEEISALKANGTILTDKQGHVSLVEDKAKEAGIDSEITDDYLKRDPEELNKLKETDPDRYKSLKNEIATEQMMAMFQQMMQAQQNGGNPNMGMMGGGFGNMSAGGSDRMFGSQWDWLIKKDDKIEVGTETGGGAGHQETPS